MRRRESLTPEVARELETLDRALAGEDTEGELAAVVRAVTEERPLARGDFLRELDGRVLAPARRAPSLPRFSRRALLPALGVAATLLVALVVVASLLGGGTRRQSGGGGADPLVAPQSRSAPTTSEGSTAGGAAGSGGAGSGGAAPGGTAPGGTVPGRTTRRVERSAFLSLGAPADRVDDVADGIVRVTDEQRGIVVSSNVSSGSGGGGAQFELQVPVERLAPALASLSRLADVQSRSQSSQDITGAFVSPRERLTDALAERRALLRQLAKARTRNATASIRARLRAASRQAAGARAELRGLRQRTSFSRISVSVSPKRGAAGGWGLRDALDDALRVLAVSLGVALVALAVALPFALALAALGLGARALRRRRREAALDAV